MWCKKSSSCQITSVYGWQGHWFAFLSALQRTSTLQWHLLVRMRSVPFNCLWLTWWCMLLASLLSVCIGISLAKFAIWTKHIVLSADSISPVSCNGKCVFLYYPFNLHILHILLPGLHQHIRTLCVFSLQWETLKKSFVNFDLYIKYVYIFSIFFPIQPLYDEPYKPRIQASYEKCWNVALLKA